MRYKGGFILKPADFFKKIKPGAFRNYQVYNVLPSVTAAQAALESGWGESLLTKQANNLFGMKGNFNGSSVTMLTTEYDKYKGYYQIHAAFRKYPSWAASIGDHGNNLVYSGYYPKSAFKTKSYATQIGLIGPVYATDGSYVSKIIGVIKQYSLDRWDQEAFSGKDGGSLDLSELDGLWGEATEEYKSMYTDLIKQNSYTRPKLKASGMQGVVIHEIRTTKSAKSIRTELNNGYGGKKMGFHVLIDEQSAILTVPLAERVYHIGKNLLTKEFGSNPDLTTISIGVVHRGGSFSSKLNRNVILAVAEIIRLYNISEKKVVPLYIVNGTREPEAWYSNILEYSVFLGVLESVKKEGDAAITNPNYGGSSGGTHNGLLDDHWRVYDYLYQIALKTIKKFPGMSITSGQRDGDSFHHGRHMAIDLAFPASFNYNEEKYMPVANWVFESFPDEVAYVITQNKVRDRVGSSGRGSSGKWVTWEAPPGDHYDHLHISGKLGENEIKKDGSSKPTLNTKGAYVAKISGSVNAYNEDTGGYSIKRLSEGEYYRVEEVGKNSIQVQSRLISSNDFSTKNFYDTYKEGEMWIPIHSNSVSIAQVANAEAPIGVANILSTTRVMDIPSNMGEQVYDRGILKQVEPGDEVSIYAIENRFALISPTEEEWIPIASPYCTINIDIDDKPSNEVEYEIGQTIETSLITRSETENSENSIGFIDGYTGWAHSDLFPIGSVLKIEVPTKPSFNREIVILSNKLNSKDGNHVEVYLESPIEAYNFGMRNALITLKDVLPYPEGVVDYFRQEGLVG